MRWDSRKTYTEEISSDSDGLQIIRRMIEELPFQCRVIFKLVVLEEMKYQEVATYLDLSVNTVKTQMKIAYKILREKLRPYHALLLVFYLSRHFFSRKLLFSIYFSVLCNIFLLKLSIFSPVLGSLVLL